MDAPEIPGIEIVGKIGPGVTGEVYRARKEDGTECAVKVFRSIAINSSLLISRVSRVNDAGAQDVTVPIWEISLKARPPFAVMPLLADPGESGVIFPRTLQGHWSSYVRHESIWPFLLKLAGRLSILHGAKVAHGNLKPGNLFLGPNGGPLLGDYATGLMPEVGHLGYTDALLYAAPEQLRNSSAYFEEAGYRWDVFAFGVLAYRLMTDRFPRCHETFSSVSPSPGTYQKFEIDADLGGIAENLESEPQVTWPDEPSDDHQARIREVINFCLSLDPMGRPADMREVARSLDAIEGEVAAAEAEANLIAKRQRAERRRDRASRRAKVAAAIAIVLGSGWAVTQYLRKEEVQEVQSNLEATKESAEEEIENLAAERDLAKLTEKTELERAAQLEEELRKEQEKVNVKIRSAQLTNETLFQWILEEGVSGLPVLEGRQARLELLDEQIGNQLKEMEGRTGLVDQISLLRLRQAEVALAMEKVEEGESLLEKAIADGSLSEAHTARARMRLLLLLSKRSPGEVSARLADAEKAIEQGWKDGSPKKLRAKAALNLVKARMCEARQDNAKALKHYLASLEDYRELAQKFPETPAVAMTLGRQYLSTATAAEGEGSLDKAAELRGEAAAAFAKLAEKMENPDPELEYQIASAAAAEAVAKWQQGDTFEAEKLARIGMAKLTGLSEKLPGDFRVQVDLASQQGIIATALRDEGKAEEAKNLLTEGIKALGLGLEKDPDQFDARYLLASLKWQLSGILGQLGESDREMEMGAAAHDDLQKLLESDMSRPHPSAVRKSLAYLCSDLGHSADLKEKTDLAIEYLEESKRYWQELARDEGDQMEIREGYHWAVNRLAEIQKN